MMVPIECAIALKSIATRDQSVKTVSIDRLPNRQPDVAKHVRTRALDVDCQGRPASVEVAGESPDLVMIGAAAPMMWTAPAARSLTDLGFRVANFDYGPPPRWDQGSEPRSAVDQLRDVLNVMDAVGMHRAHAIGLSRGAMTAFSLAARAPDRVDRLVLAFPVAGFADTMLEGEPELEPHPLESSQQYLDRVVLPSLFSEQFLERHRDEAIELVTSRPGTVSRLDRSEEEPFRPFDRVSSPTLIIEGEEDVIVSSKHPALYSTAIPRAQYVRVPGARHGWIMEEPARLAQMVSDFLRSA